MESEAIGASLRSDAHGSYVLFATAASLAYTGPGSQPARGSNVVRFRSDRPGQWPYVAPIILLFCSNLFMTLAWYGHLKFKAVSLVIVVLVSWGIAFVEYCFAVPANRIGSAVYSPAELKTIQEVITLIVFAGFTAIYFDEPLSWTQAAGFALIALGAALVFHGQT